MRVARGFSNELFRTKKCTHVEICRKIVRLISDIETVVSFVAIRNASQLAC